MRDKVGLFVRRCTGASPSRDDNDDVAPRADRQVGNAANGSIQFCHTGEEIKSMGG